MRLDKHRPYSHVHGLAGVAFAQDGHYFGGNGHVAVDPEAETETETAEPSSPVPTAALDPVSLPPPEPILKVGPDDMRLAVNKALKVQMDNYGEPWQGVEHARKFLGMTE